MEVQKLKSKLHEQKSKIGLVGSTITIKEYDSAEHNVSARISQKGWDVEIFYKKGYNPIATEQQKAYAEKKGIPDGLETLLSDVTLHEFGHWELPYGSEKGCPYDIYNHDKILEAVKNALPNDKKGQANYVANAFEDLTVNKRCREWAGKFAGQVLFFDSEGSVCKEKGLKHFTPFYEAFVRLNLYLWGDKDDRSLLKQYYSHNKKISKAIKQVTSELNLSELRKNTEQLFNREDWPEMAKAFAKSLAPLLEQPPIERLSAFLQAESAGSGNDNKDGQKAPAGNGIEQKLGTKEGKEGVAYGRYSAGEKQSCNFTSYEQLDALYKRLARAIPINVEAMTKEQSLPIAPLTYRPFNDEKDDVSKIKLSKLFITDDGLKFAHQKQPLTIYAKSKVQKRGFPDFKMIVLDNSGSMKESIDGSSTGREEFIPWGDNSKYHYALLGFYGIENFLQMQGVAQYINHGLSVFSSQTRYKESNFSGINEVRKLALAPEFGNTYIDASSLKQALKGKESFVLSISDGEIGNWDSEKKDFKELAENNYFAHIQIGDETKFTKDLEAFGLPVFYVSSGKDLSKLMVNITKKAYEGFIKETSQ